MLPPPVHPASHSNLKSIYHSLSPHSLTHSLSPTSHSLSPFFSLSRFHPLLSHTLSLPLIISLHSLSLSLSHSLSLPLSHILSLSLSLSFVIVHDWHYKTFTIFITLSSSYKIENYAHDNRNDLPTCIIIYICLLYTSRCV